MNSKKYFNRLKSLNKRADTKTVRKVFIDWLITFYAFDEKDSLTDDEYGEMIEIAGQFKKNDYLILVPFFARALQFYIDRKLYKSLAEALVFGLTENMEYIYKRYDAESMKEYSPLFAALLGFYWLQAYIVDCEVHEKLKGKTQTVIEDGFIANDSSLQTSKDYFEGSLAENPKHALGNFGLGKLYFFSLGAAGYDKALRYLTKAALNDVRDWENYYLLGKIYIFKKNYNDAEKWYARGLELHDEDGIVLVVQEMKTDLEPIDGGSIPYEDFISRNAEIEGVDNHAMRERLAQVFNAKMPSKIRREIRERAEGNLKKFFGERGWAGLANDTREFLSVAESSFCKRLKARDPEEKNASIRDVYDYLKAVEVELMDKIFQPFKVDFFKKKFPSERERRLEIENLFKDKDTKIFAKFLKDAKGSLTLGQIVGVLDIQPAKRKSVGDFIEFVSRKTNDLLCEPKFLKEVSEICKMRSSSIEHTKAFRGYSFREDFIPFRDIVLGHGNCAGILVRFIKSYQS